MPIDCVSVDTLLIHSIGAMNAADITFYNSININVSKFSGFFVRYFGKLHLDILNEFLLFLNGYL